jgi:hypothetical protein
MSTKIILPVLAGILLTGCLDENSNTPTYGLERFKSATAGTSQCSDDYDIAIQTVAPNFGSSSSVAFACNSEGAIDDNIIIKDASDFSVSSGNKFYHLGRSGSHTVTQYDFTTTNLENWTYSTNTASEESSNPYKVVEVNSQKAYIIRYDQSQVWVIDPSAQNEQDFKLGEIDLSHYRDSTEGVYAEAVDMSDALIHDGKLYIAMQRLRDGTQGQYGANRDYTNTSMIAVFDTATDIEIDTSPSDTDNEKAIILNGTNVRALSLSGDKIFSASRGDYDSLYGALEAINTSDYSVTTVVEGSESQGHITDVAAVSANNIYFTSDFSGYDKNGEYVYKTALFKFSDNKVTTLIAEGASQNIPDIAKDTNNKLWVANASTNNPGVYRFDTTSDNAELFLATELNPAKIVFRQ